MTDLFVMDSSKWRALITSLFCYSLSFVLLDPVCPSLSLANPPQLLIRNAALVLTMDPSLGVVPWEYRGQRCSPLWQYHCLGGRKSHGFR